MSLSFPQGTPESVGIRAVWLANMMERWEKSGCHVHGFEILRHGVLAARVGRWPYALDKPRLVHSVSKTFTQLAVGMLWDQGLLRLEDPVLKYFPDFDLSRNPTSERLMALTIHHLLTMGSGHDGDTAISIHETGTGKPAWEAFLEQPIAVEPGTRFLYNGGCSYLLSVIVTRLTGQTVFEFLKPRLFQPLDMGDLYWEELDGFSAGGYGLNISLDDMLKVGQLFLQKGRWGNQQLVSDEWIRLATERKINSTLNNVYPDWTAGYCYQMWRCSRSGGYRADGAFGQYILVLPEKDMTVAIWSEEPFPQDMLDVFYEEVYDRLDDRVYGVEGNSMQSLGEKIIRWAQPVSQAPTSSWLEPYINNRTYCLWQCCLDSVCFFFDGAGTLTVRFSRGGSDTVIRAGNVIPIQGEDMLCFEPASFTVLHGQIADRPFPYCASYSWLSSRTMLLRIVWTGLAHTTEVEMVFGNEDLAMVITPSYEKYQLHEVGRKLPRDFSRVIRGEIPQEEPPFPS